MKGPDPKYEARQQKIIADTIKRIDRIYKNSISSISFTASTLPPKTTPFSLALYPALEKEINKQISGMHKDMQKAILDGIKKSWDNSNVKNNEFVDRRLAGKRIPKRTRQILYDPNKQALDSFTARKVKGLNLSDRIWKTLEPFKTQTAQAVGLNIGEGKAAKTMASEMQKYLKNPDALYRRVRGEDGKLKLSAAARNDHPGQGVYRSSYKNALRLTRTENNMAYRTADHERWQKLPFVTGVEVRLSKNHPRYDICDSLVGKYPKDFKFVGWHPQCMCHAVPVMMSDDEYDKLEDQILFGDMDADVKSGSTVTKTPAGFNKYVQDNKQRIEGWSNTPYWVKDNPEYYKAATVVKKAKSENVDYSKLNLDRYLYQVRRDPYDKVYPNMTDEMKAAVHGYTQDMYYPLNNFLRGQKVTPERAEELTNYRNLLNNALDQIKEEYKDIVFRGANLKAEHLQNYRNALKRDKPIQHEFFTSSSIDPGQRFEGNTYYIIKSKHGKIVEKLSAYGSEKEVLFKAGTKFRVTGVELGEKAEIYLEEI